MSFSHMFRLGVCMTSMISRDFMAAFRECVLIKNYYSHLQLTMLHPSIVANQLNQNKKCTKVLNLAALPSVYCRVHVDVH